MHSEWHNLVASGNGFWIKGLVCIGRHGAIVSTRINILLCLCTGGIQSKLHVQATGLQGSLSHTDDLHCLCLKAFMP